MSTRVRDAWSDTVAWPRGPGSWVGTHMRALQSTDPHVMALRRVLRGLADYADAHESQFESPIGDDCVLGESWKDALAAVRALLNGPTGNLDCGVAMAKAAGVELE